LISRFLEYTANDPSSELFRLWSAISTIAGSVGRNVWLNLSGGKVYPNLLVMLVAPPGVGKSKAITFPHELWSDLESVHVASTSITTKGLVDELADAQVMSNGIVSHCLNVSALEFGVFLPKYDLSFMNIINDLYDCGRVFKERTRGGGVVDIINPYLNMICGTQPKYLGETLPEAAYGMGFTSRIIMVYWGKVPKIDFFSSGFASDPMGRQSIMADLKELTTLHGAFTITEAAKEAFNAWYAETDNNAPTHSKLTHYNTRRPLHLLKLSMVMALADEGTLEINENHIMLAQEILHDVEALMPEIFKEISSGSQAADIEEAFHFMMQLWLRTRKPISEQRLVAFLQNRVPVREITPIIETMLSAGIIEEHNQHSGIDLRGLGLTNRLFIPKTLNKFE